MQLTPIQPILSVMVPVLAAAPVTDGGFSIELGAPGGDLPPALPPQPAMLAAAGDSDTAPDETAKPLTQDLSPLVTMQGAQPFDVPMVQSFTDSALLATLVASPDVSWVTKVLPAPPQTLRGDADQTLPPQTPTAILRAEVMPLLAPNTMVPDRLGRNLAVPDMTVLRSTAPYAPVTSPDRLAPATEQVTVAQAQSPTPAAQDALPDQIGTSGRNQTPHAIIEHRPTALGHHWPQEPAAVAANSIPADASPATRPLHPADNPLPDSLFSGSPPNGGPPSGGTQTGGTEIRRPTPDISPPDSPLSGKAALEGPLPDQQTRVPTSHQVTPIKTDMASGPTGWNAPQTLPSPRGILRELPTIMANQTARAPIMTGAKTPVPPTPTDVGNSVKFIAVDASAQSMLGPVPHPVQSSPMISNGLPMTPVPTQPPVTAGIQLLPEPAQTPNPHANLVIATRPAPVIAPENAAPTPVQQSLPLITSAYEPLSGSDDVVIRQAPESVDQKFAPLSDIWRTDAPRPSVPPSVLPEAGQASLANAIHLQSSVADRPRYTLRASDPTVAPAMQTAASDPQSGDQRPDAALPRPLAMSLALPSSSPRPAEGVGRTDAPPAPPFSPPARVQAATSSPAERQPLPPADGIKTLIDTDPAALPHRDAHSLPPVMAAPGTTSGAIPSTPAPLPAPSQIAQTIVQNVQRAGTGPIDVVLRPEELGQVRFEMHPNGDRLHVVLFVERPEALDLLRRNIEQFLSDLRQSGYQQTSLSFGDWGQRDSHRSGANGTQGQMSDIDADLPALPRHTLPAPMAVDGRLDLRL